MESNGLSLRAFFYDYCITSTNPNLSRGFLPGLEMLPYRQGPKSDLVKACQRVSFASHGKPLNRPKLVQKACMFYQEVPGSSAKAIQSPVSANAVETKFIAMLLGLYQVLTHQILNHLCGHQKTNLTQITTSDETSCQRSSSSYENWSLDSESLGHSSIQSYWVKSTSCKLARSYLSEISI